MRQELNTVNNKTCWCGRTAKWGFEEDGRIVQTSCGYHYLGLSEPTYKLDKKGVLIK